MDGSTDTSWQLELPGAVRAVSGGVSHWHRTNTNRGFLSHGRYPQEMDGLFHRKSIDKWMIILFEGSPILGTPQTSIGAWLERPERSHVDVFVPQLLRSTGAWPAGDPVPNRS